MKTPKTFKNILIVRTDRIGDVVLTTPAIKSLRQAYPAARISILVAPSTYDLVNGNPYVDEILVDDRKGRHKNLFGFLRLAREIRLKKFDLAIIFHTKRRYNLACYTAGIPCRLGYKNNKFGFLLTHPLKDIRPQGTKHEAKYCMDLLKVMGVENDDLDIFVPLQKEAEGWMSHWMQENNLKPNEFIAIHPGSSDPAKCWPTANFALLMDRLAERYALKIVLIGSVQTMPVAAEILRQTQKTSQFLDLTGKTSLAQMVSLLRRARLLISNDSGPVHVAAGVGTSVISLFLRNQPGINAERWKPLGVRSFILSNSPASLSVENVLELTGKIFLKNKQYEIF
jgi:heptosyltransferase-2